MSDIFHGEDQIERNEIRMKAICRFCLTQNDITNITPEILLQIMNCPSLNQYDDEDLPEYICNQCHRLVDHCANFYRMIKRANKLLSQYQFTGLLPNQLERPYLPLEKTMIDAATNTTLKETCSIEIQTDFEDFFALDTPDKIEQCKIEGNEYISETISLDEACDEASEDFMYTETSILYEPCEANEDLILEETEDTIKPINIEQISNETEDENFNEHFSCEVCELSFPLRQLRDIHLNEHSRVRKFQCLECDKKFYTKKDLQQHEAVHSSEKPFKCGLCNKGFTRKSSLERHESKHGEIPKYLCIYCEKSFNCRETLEDHMTTHDKAQKFTCQVCFKSFAFRKNLIRHSSVHQQIFGCQYCEEGYATQKKLATHLLTHSNTTVTYFCESCKKMFSNSKKFNRHMRLHNKKSLNCFYCNKNFKNRDEYVQHTALHSKANLICTLCLMQFNDSNEVDEHIKLHINGEIFACEFCDFLCLTETELSLHLCTNESNKKNIPIHNK